MKTYIMKDSEVICQECGEERYHIDDDYKNGIWICGWCGGKTKLIVGSKE